MHFPRISLLLFVSIGSLAAAAVLLSEGASLDAQTARNFAVAPAGQTVSNVNLCTLAGNPTQPGNYVFTIPAGTTINSTDSTQPALTTGTCWAPGFTITLINNGNIYGRGGDGGDRGNLVPCNTSLRGEDGDAGGDAVWLNYPMAIDNTSGSIFGAGGGGGGGKSVVGGRCAHLFGGSGGGGQGSVNSAGGGGNFPGGFPGDAGTVSAPGKGNTGGGKAGAGRGGSGGAWGMAGQNGTGGSLAGLGGPPGAAIRGNGAVTWLGGNDPEHVKGAVEVEEAQAEPEQPSLPPTEPSVSAGAACIVGTPISVAMRSADPEGDRIRYQVDWGATGGANQLLPAVGFVPSGTELSATRTHAVAGEKIVRVRAEDENGALSPWATFSYSCADSAQDGFSDDGDNDGDAVPFFPPLQNPDLEITATPSLVRSGRTVRVNWSASEGYFTNGCTVEGSNGNRWEGYSSPPAGVQSLPIIGETTFTLTCFPENNDGHRKRATVRILPIWREL